MTDERAWEVTVEEEQEIPERGQEATPRSDKGKEMGGGDGQQGGSDRQQQNRLGVTRRRQEAQLKQPGGEK